MSRIPMLLLFTACATPHPDAFTVVGVQEGHKVSLSWEGGDACAGVDDVEVRCFPADSAAAAVWRWYTPDAPEVLHAQWFQPALSDDALAAVTVDGLRSPTQVVAARGGRTPP